MSTTAMSMKDRIETKLRAALAPQALEVIDDSRLHAGHHGHSGVESHFRVRIVAEGFRGASRMARHRLINTILAEELAGPVHALVIERAEPPAA